MKPQRFYLFSRRSFILPKHSSWMLHRLLLREHLSSQWSLKDHFTSQHLCYKANLTLAEGEGGGAHQFLFYKIHNYWCELIFSKVWWGRNRFWCIQWNGGLRFRRFEHPDKWATSVDTPSGHITSGATQTMPRTYLFYWAGAKLHLSSTRVHTLIVKHQQANSHTHFHYNRPLWTKAKKMKLDKDHHSLT